MIFVTHFPFPVNDLALRPEILFSAEEGRPAFCPSCGQVARDPARKHLGILGQGIYYRQVRGFSDLPPNRQSIPIRRYRCKGCGATISVLPDELYPGRWFAAPQILLALFLTHLLGLSAEEVRDRLGGWGLEPGWKTLRRWRRGLLTSLWGWLGPKLGIHQEAWTRSEGTRRLTLLLAQGSLHPPWGEGQREGVMALARRLLAHTAHSLGRGWRLRPHLQPSS